MMKSLQSYIQSGRRRNDLVRTAGSISSRVQRERWRALRSHSGIPAQQCDETETLAANDESDLMLGEGD